MNWLRQYVITAGVPGQEGFEISSLGNNRPLHVNFELEKADTQSSNTGKLQISNLSAAHKAILGQDGCMVEIKAGYTDAVSSLFLGSVSNPTETLSGADRTLELELIDGFSNYDAVGSMSINDVVTADMVLTEFQAQMGVESVIITEQAAALLATAKYGNGYCYVGRLKAGLQALVAKAGLSFSMQNGVLQVFYPGEAITTQAYVLSADTGLISIPKKITISESSTSKTGTKKTKSESSGSSESWQSDSGIPGYEVEYFINGAIGINDLVKVESKNLTGVFRVKKQTYRGDNYSGDWTCTAQLVEVTA